MLPPYLNCPLMNQYPYNMHQTQPFGFYGQQYMPPGMLMPQQYQLQAQGEAYDYMLSEGMSPAAVSPRDPPPVLSNNPVTASISLFKELTGYPNYGNPSRNADILYTGNRGTWTFETPAFLFVPGNLRGQIRIRAVLDDHAGVPVNRYSARITINGDVVHNGRVPLEHGVPVGGIFTNWRELSFNIANPRRVTRVTIENTSTAGANDWIAFDWMEIRFLPR